MILNRAIKMWIYPDDEQRHKIDVTLNHCRYIYNKMLERNNVIYKRRKEHLNYYAMQNLLPEEKFIDALQDQLISDEVVSWILSMADAGTVIECAKYMLSENLLTKEDVENS